METFAVFIFSDNKQQGCKAALNFKTRNINHAQF